MAELDPLDVHLGLRLRVMRNARRMSMQTLGETIGVTYQQVQKYETGATRIAASTLYRIANVLRVDLEWFLQGLDGSGDDVAPDAKAVLTTAAMERMEPKVRQAICGLIDAIVKNESG